MVFPWALMGSRNAKKIRSGGEDLCHNTFSGCGTWQERKVAWGFLALVESEEAMQETGSPGITGMGRLTRSSVWDT